MGGRCGGGWDCEAAAAAEAMGLRLGGLKVEVRGAGHRRALLTRLEEVG